MASTFCTVDHTPQSGEAVRVAVERAARHGDEIRFVGVVKPFTDAAGPAYGERVRRFGLVEINLVHACRAARAAGLDPTLERRFGEPLSESVAAADEIGAGEIVLAEPKGLFQTRANVVTVTRPQRERRQLALVA
ncbi:MAG TPA: universal stress protein [Gaiellaceae bacterium]|jgi:nucleotide-binding universal stress UspA family protein